MFVFVHETLYIASGQKATELLKLEAANKLKKLYIGMITVVAVPFVLIGPLPIPIILTSPMLDTPQGQVAGTIASIVLLLLGLAAMFIIHKIFTNIAHVRQERQMKRLINQDKILQFPQPYQAALVEMLRISGCQNFLSYYKPGAYDFGDLKTLFEEVPAESISHEFFEKSAKPTLRRIANRICAAQRQQEGSYTRIAKALDELPRPEVDE